MSTETQVFACPICSSDCPSAEALKKHKQRKHRDALNMEHNEKKVFACHLCGKNDLRDNDKLKKHVVVCEKKRSKEEENNMMGPPMARKLMEEAKKEEGASSRSRGGHCMKS